MNYTEEAKQNFNDLSKNPYPGRGIVLGTSADDRSTGLWAAASTAVTAFSRWNRRPAS